MQVFLKKLFRPPQFVEGEIEDVMVEPCTPSPAKMALWMIIGAFLESEETEIEVSAANMAAIISSFEKPDVWDFDIAKVPIFKSKEIIPTYIAVELLV